MDIFPKSRKIYNDLKLRYTFSKLLYFSSYVDVVEVFTWFSWNLLSWHFGKVLSFILRKSNLHNSAPPEMTNIKMTERKTVFPTVANELCSNFLDFLCCLNFVYKIQSLRFIEKISFPSLRLYSNSKVELITLAKKASFAKDLIGIFWLNTSFFHPWRKDLECKN